MPVYDAETAEAQERYMDVPFADLTTEKRGENQANINPLRSLRSLRFFQSIPTLILETN